MSPKKTTPNLQKQIDVLIEEFHQADVLTSTDKHLCQSAMGFCASVSDTLLTYRTPHIVSIKSKKIGGVSRLVQLIIIFYVIGYVIIYKKGYQEFSSINSSVTTKLKGTAFPNFTNDQFNLPHPEIYRKVWDVADFVIPPQEENAFFVTTNVIITPNQTQGKCPDNPESIISQCDIHRPFNPQCINGQSLRNGNGIMTGRCVPSAIREETAVCEVQGWCPVERDELPLRGKRALLADSQHFTVLIKNSIEFPLFNIRRRNINDRATSAYLINCNFDKYLDPSCPIFELKTIVSDAGEDYERMAIKGGVIAIIINWDCNIDFDPDKYCFPTYAFRRLDDPNVKISNGWNFRYAHYHSTDKRVLFKVYGIRFVILVQGRAGKFNLVPLLLNIGSGFALLGVTTIICDLLVLYVMKKKKYYKEKKFTEV